LFSVAIGGVVPATPLVKEIVMGEFDKGQGKDEQSGQQNEKPAFGQFDNEKGQGQQDQGQEKQPQDETTGADQQGDNEIGTDKGEPDQQR
jgi:hypothetical protein